MCILRIICRFVEFLVQIHLHSTYIKHVINFSVNMYYKYTLYCHINLFDRSLRA